jgi:L-rhamnose mutarotase
MSVEEQAFRMKLKRGAATEYLRRHDAIWPELVADMRARGICDYRIWLDEATGDLFAVIRRDPAITNTAAPSAIVRRWWDFMADLMEVQADNAPLQSPLTSAFVWAGSR